MWTICRKGTYDICGTFEADCAKEALQLFSCTLDEGRIRRTNDGHYLLATKTAVYTAKRGYC